VASGVDNQLFPDPFPILARLTEATITRTTGAYSQSVVLAGLSKVRFVGVEVERDAPLGRGIPRVILELDAVRVVFRLAPASKAKRRRNKRDAK